MLAYRAEDQCIIGPDRGDAFQGWHTWRAVSGPSGLVAAALLAASPHNTQPWLFDVDAETVSIYADPARRLTAVDPYGREMYLGLGCALENIILAGRARGLAPTVDLPAAGAIAALVRLGSGTPQVTPEYEAIGWRRSNRGPYRRKPLLQPYLDEMAALIDDPGVSLLWITAADERRRLGSLLVAAAEAVVADEAMSREGFDWFRAGADAIARHRDGLTLDGQGLSQAVLTVAKLLPPVSRLEGDSFWLQRTREVHTATAAGYGLLLVDDPRDRGQLIRAGRVLQRLHLAATARWLAVQHMNQVSERVDRDRSLGREPRLASALSTLTRGSSRTVVSCFRLGHPAEPGRMTPRRVVAEVVR